MPAHISDELSATTLKWIGLAALQVLIYAILYFATDIGSGWYFLEPALVVLGAVYVLRTGSHRVAVAMFAYLVLVLAIGLGVVFLQVADENFSAQAVFDALHPLHRAKEIAEFFLLDGAWKAVGATKELRQVRTGAATA